MPSICRNCYVTLSQSGITTGDKSYSPNKECSLCEGMWDRLELLAYRSLQTLYQRKYEWNSFWVAIRFAGGVDEGRKLLRSYIKSALRTKLTDIISNDAKRAARKDSPDILITIGPNHKTEVFSAPLFIKGVYQKRLAGISQSKWICQKCAGRGCFECDFTGRYYALSVQELIGYPAAHLFQAAGYYLHAAGREDVDVTVEGHGRPFVLELTDPRLRGLNLKQVEKYINKYSAGLVSVKLVEYGTARDREIVKRAENHYKMYLGTIRFRDEVDDKELLVLTSKLSGATIAQRTPFRVLRRRADLIRRKYIKSFSIVPLNRRTAKFEVVCEGGTYVKEFISGDDGRTSPSVSEILGIQSVCTELRMLGVMVESDKNKGFEKP
jgi:tRNA pseudouridine synthase 10